MEFYYVHYTTYHNDTQIGTKIGKALIDGNPEDREIAITWDNVDEYYRNSGGMYRFNIWKTKKGRRVSFFIDDLFPGFKDRRDVKEWKEELNIRIKISYRKYTPSIEDVLEWHNAEDAIKYLKEKGLSIKI